LLIAYDSKTGNVKRFVKKLNMHTVKIADNLLIEEPFILVTYTTGFGEVPETTARFLERNYKFLKGVAASGNKNWGNNYAKSAELISMQYNVPIISKFELSGTNQDVARFLREVEKVVTNSKLDSPKQ
jgi:protein involved in ribonucleotide reduction